MARTEGNAQGRGWGPFTGRQLTTMICVVAVVVMLPVGAWAVTGSNSFITDKTTGAQASVTPAHQLQVKAANGVVVKVQGAGSGHNADVTKDQQLLTAEASPGNYLVSSSDAGEGFAPQLINVPGGDAVVVKSLQITSFNTTGADPYFQLDLSSNNCISEDSTIEFVDVPSGANAVTVLPFTPGLVVPAGDELCMNGSAADADTVLTGYTLPGADAAGAIHASVTGHKATPKP